MNSIIKAIPAVTILLVTGHPVVAQDPAAQPTAQERVAALKANLAASQALLRQFEWIETTAVSLKGDEKSKQLQRCYYGADGKVQKLPVVAPPPEEKKRGLRGKIAENKKEEMSDYMKEAVALVKMYIPPDQIRIQGVKDAGKLAFAPQPNQRLRMTFTDYLKAGDSLTLDVDLATNRPLAATVASYLDSDKAAVTLSVTFGTLNNGASYAAQTVLNAQAKNLTVNVENSGYRPVAP